MLNDHHDVSEGAEKYMGNKNFTEMSKKIGREWKRIDALTRSVFDKLAEEG